MEISETTMQRKRREAAEKAAGFGPRQRAQFKKAGGTMQDRIRYHLGLGPDEIEPKTPLISPIFDTKKVEAAGGALSPLFNPEKVANAIGEGTPDKAVEEETPERNKEPSLGNFLTQTFWKDTAAEAIINKIKGTEKPKPKDNRSFGELLKDIAFGEMSEEEKREALDIAIMAGTSGIGGGIGIASKGGTSAFSKWIAKLGLGGGAAIRNDVSKIAAGNAMQIPKGFDKALLGTIPVAHTVNLGKTTALFASLGASLGVAGVLTSLLGIYPFAGFIQEETIQTVGYGIETAVLTGDYDAAEDAVNFLEEVLDKTLWEKIIAVIPFANISYNLKEFREGAAKKLAIDKEFIKMMRETGGMTYAEKEKREYYEAIEAGKDLDEEEKRAYYEALDKARAEVEAENREYYAEVLRQATAREAEKREYWNTIFVEEGGGEPSHLGFGLL